MTCNAILENIVADVLVLFMGISVAWLYALAVGRRRLLKFFGVAKSRRVTLYVSRLNVLRFGSLGADGLFRSYQGSAVPFSEMRVAERFRDLFNYFVPSWVDKPAWLKRLLISDVELEIMQGPPVMKDTSGAYTLITLGSPAYNQVSRFVERKLQSQARFNLRAVMSLSTDAKPSGLGDPSPENRAEVLCGSSPGLTLGANRERAEKAGRAGPVLTDGEVRWPTSGSSELPPVESRLRRGAPEGEGGTLEVGIKGSGISIRGLPEITDLDRCFVERLVDRSREITVFYAAGLTEHGTRAAAHCLATKWRDLHQRFKADSPFLVLLRVDPEDYTVYEIVLERRGNTD